MWARSPRLALSRRTLHYPKVIWTKVGINVGTIVEVGTISAYLSLSEGGFGPKLSKVGTIGSGFGLKVSTIGAQIGPSGHYEGYIWSKGGFGHTIEWLKWTIPHNCRQNHGVKRTTRTLRANESISSNDPEHPIETFI